MKRTILIILITVGIFSIGFLLAFAIQINNTEDQAIGYKVKIYKNEDGSFKELTTWKILSDSTTVPKDGFTVKMLSNGGRYGAEKRMIIPIEDRQRNKYPIDSIRWKKEGEWVYFDLDGNVDSIIFYGDYAGMEYRVDTGMSDDGTYWYIDSLAIMKYNDKRIIFKK